MAARAGVTRERLLDAATAEVDAHGPEGLTLAAVAQRLGVRTPSLYSHVDGLGGLRVELRLRGLERLDEALRDATVGRARGDALRGLASAYRAFARTHPGLYALAQVADPQEPTAAASRRVVETVVATLRGYGLDGDPAVHATRVLRSGLHGFVSLETGGGFGLALDVEASFAALVDALEAGLERMARGGAVGAG